jgi:hypothetical protein
LIRDDSIVSDNIETIHRPVQEIMDEDYVFALIIYLLLPLMV